MKMFLTRIGFGTKAVVTGDVTQIDLARGQKSGLIESRAHPRAACAASRFVTSRAPTSCVTRSSRRSSTPTTATAAKRKP
jgi:predicted ribonuclease YlaK